MTIFSSTNSAQSNSWYPDTEERIKKKMARPSFKKSDVDEKLIIKTGIQATENEHEKMKNGNKTENGMGWMRIRMGLPIDLRTKLGFVAIFHFPVPCA